jgi:hypothetical protein
MGIALVISFLLSFPYNFIAVLGALFLINLLRRRKVMKRYCRIKGIKHSFDSLSTSTSSNQNSPIKYYCMSCGNEHKEIECPNCGSKMKRAG